MGVVTDSGARGDGVVVSARLRGRPWDAVLADMIEGVVVANRLAPPASDRLRAELWAACGAEQVASVSSESKRVA